jgi:hypothetical protein
MLCLVSLHYPYLFGALACGRKLSCLCKQSSFHLGEFYHVLALWNLGILIEYSTSVKTSSDGLISSSAKGEASCD